VNPVTDILKRRRPALHGWPLTEAPEAPFNLRITTTAFCQQVFLGPAFDGEQLGDPALPPPTVSVIAPASEKQEKYNDNKNG